MPKLHHLLHDDIFTSQDVDGVVENANVRGFISVRKNKLPTNRVIKIGQTQYPLSMAMVTNVYPFKFINGEALPTDSLCFSIETYVYAPDNYPGFIDYNYNFKTVKGDSQHTHKIITAIRPAMFKNKAILATRPEKR